MKPSNLKPSTSHHNNHLHFSHAGKQIYISVMCFENAARTLGGNPVPALVGIVIPTALIGSQEVQYVEYS